MYRIADKESREFALSFRTQKGNVKEIIKYEEHLNVKVKKRTNHQLDIIYLYLVEYGRSHSPYLPHRHISNSLVTIIVQTQVYENSPQNMLMQHKKYNLLQQHTIVILIYIQAGAENE